LTPVDQPLTARDRVVAGAEVLLGAAAVILHNVYRLVPNEVPILVLILEAQSSTKKAWTNPLSARAFCAGAERPTGGLSDTFAVVATYLGW